MKHSNKWIAVILCLILCIYSPYNLYAAENSELKDKREIEGELNSYSIPVISKEYPYSYVNFYEYQGKYYLPFKDVIRFTRCQYTISGTELILTHGIRKIQINKATGQITDSNFMHQGSVPILLYEGDYLCEGIPMLSYLGATCSIRDSRMLEVQMPAFTIWESIMPDYLDYPFNMLQIYHSKDNLNLALACDIVSVLLEEMSDCALSSDKNAELDKIFHHRPDANLTKDTSIQCFENKAFSKTHGHTSFSNRSKFHPAKYTSPSSVTKLTFIPFFFVNGTAVWLNMLQQNTAQLLSQMLLDENNHYHFTNKESLTNLKNTFTLFYRTTMAFSESMVWANPTDNAAVIYLYRIQNCSVNPIVEYAAFCDNLLTSAWVKKYKNNRDDIFKQLPKNFDFRSGVGAWNTEFDLNSDGTFVGEFHDSEMGSTGENFPNGTVYICNFKGKFSTPKRIEHNVYSMKLAYLDYEGIPDEEYYKDNIRFIYSTPYGLDNADEILLYLPGCLLKNVSEGFRFSPFVDPKIRRTLPSGYFGIYNVNEKKSFIGLKENNPWRKSYINHSETGYSSFVSDCSTGYLNFLLEPGKVELSLSFPWSYDNQTEFIASDSNEKNGYNINIQFKDDYQSAVISVKSPYAYDFRPWGGNSDGTLSAEYQCK